MAKQRQRLPELSPAQHEIMECIWQQEELSAADVRKLLRPKRDVARNTVRTLLERMVEKGWLKYRQQGRTYLYSAAQEQQATVGDKLAELVDRACGGSPEMLVAALIDVRGLTSAELGRIRKMLDETQARGGATSKGSANSKHSVDSKGGK
jgi:BlaI family transcriptional regulator, penicillinase repressor